jgi:hypothetical protein
LGEEDDLSKYASMAILNLFGSWESFAIPIVWILQRSAPVKSGIACRLVSRSIRESGKLLAIA